MSETPEMQAAREMWPDNGDSGWMTSDPSLKAIHAEQDKLAAIIREKATGPLRKTFTELMQTCFVYRHDEWYFRTRNGVPMEMPERYQKIVARAAEVLKEE